MPVLDWLNKDKAGTTAQQVPYRLLEPVPELSVGEAADKNSREKIGDVARIFIQLDS